MGRTVAYRLVAALPLLVLVSILAFALVHLMPGSASETILGDGANPEAVAELDRALGLDKPLVTQYFTWAGNALSGDFGTSPLTGRSVTDTLTERIPVTLSVAIAGLTVAVLLGIPTGIWAALRYGRWMDRMLSLVTATGLAVPNFWIGILLAYWVGVRTKWLPAVGYTPFAEDPVEWVKSLILPGIALGIGSAAVIARQMRGGLLEVLDRPYIRTARSKGMSFRRVVVVHALKNAFTPVATVLGFQVSVMLGGAVVVEQVFGIPGIGGQLIRAVIEQDIPVIQGVVMFTAVVVIVVNIVIDLSYAAFDPRVRVQ